MPKHKMLLAHLIAVNTMDESFLDKKATTGIIAFKGNPTECALLALCNEMVRARLNSEMYTLLSSL